MGAKANCTVDLHEEIQGLFIWNYASSLKSRRAFSPHVTRMAPLWAGLVECTWVHLTWPNQSRNAPRARRTLIAPVWKVDEMMFVAAANVLMDAEPRLERHHRADGFPFISADIPSFSSRRVFRYAPVRIALPALPARCLSAPVELSCLFLQHIECEQGRKCSPPHDIVALLVVPEECACEGYLCKLSGQAWGLCFGFGTILSLNVVLAAANYQNEHLLYGNMNALLSQSHVHNSSTCFILYSLTTPELFKFT